MGHSAIWTWYHTIGACSSLFDIYHDVMTWERFPTVVMYSMVVCLRWYYHHMLSVASYLSREGWVFVSLLPCSLWCVQMTGHFMVPWSYSLAGTSRNHCAELCENNEHLKRSSDIFGRVCVLDEVSPSYFMQYGAEPFLFWLLWKYLYFTLLLSSYRKYDSIAIV